MLARLRSFSFRRIARLLLLASAGLAIASCASKPEPQLVSDGTGGRESALPWNQQQKWENAGQFGAMADHMTERRR
jgi:hypothetical protein